MSSLLAWPNVRLNQVVVQKKNILSQKGFPKQLTLPLHKKMKMVKRKKLYEHVRIQPAINH